MTCFSYLIALLLPLVIPAAYTPPIEEDFDVNGFFNNDIDAPMPSISTVNTQLQPIEGQSYYDPLALDNDDEFDSHLDHSMYSLEDLGGSSSTAADDSQRRLNAIMMDFQQTLEQGEQARPITSKDRWFHRLNVRDQDWLIEMMVHYLGGKGRRNKIWLRFRIMNSLTEEEARLVLNRETPIDEMIRIANRISLVGEDAYRESLRDVIKMLERDGMKVITARRYVAEAKQNILLLSKSPSNVYHSVVKRWNEAHPNRRLEVKEYRHWTPEMTP